MGSSAAERYVHGCGNCGTPDVKAHCPSVTCSWVKCRDCEAVTGIVLGVIRAVGGVRMKE
jgi:hypothetical protein